MTKEKVHEIIGKHMHEAYVEIMRSKKTGDINVGQDLLIGDNLDQISDIMFGVYNQNPDKEKFTPKKHYNGVYGHTYYYNREGVLFGHPTNKDGSCDYDEDTEVEVEDFVEPLTEKELKEVKNNLK